MGASLHRSYKYQTTRGNIRPPYLLVRVTHNSYCHIFFWKTHPVLVVFNHENFLPTWYTIFHSFHEFIIQFICFSCLVSFKLANNMAFVSWFLEVSLVLTVYNKKKMKSWIRYKAVHLKVVYVQLRLSCKNDPADFAAFLWHVWLWRSHSIYSFRKVLVHRFWDLVHSILSN